MGSLSLRKGGGPTPSCFRAMLKVVHCMPNQTKMKIPFVANAALDVQLEVQQIVTWIQSNVAATCAGGVTSDDASVISTSCDWPELSAPAIFADGAAE